MTDAIFNPGATFPFCAEQTAMFTFMTAHGFAAIVMSEVQGFMAGESDKGLSALGSKVFVRHGELHYESVESVPALVARYAEIQRRVAQGQPTAPPVEQAPAPEPSPAAEHLRPQTTGNGLWKR